MTRSVLPALQLALLTAVMAQSPLLAQQARPVLSPEVHADRTVTFRLRAPQAEEVSLTGQFLDGPRALTKGADGVWSVTVGPVAPEIYEYEFTIDGMTFHDPRNPALKPNQGPAVVSSLVTVRGQVAARDGKFVGTLGRGKFLKRTPSHF